MSYHFLGVLFCYFIPFYEDRTPFLLDFNHKLLETLFNAIQLERTIGFTETYEKNLVDVDDKRLELIENDQIIEQPEYIQVFSSKYGFIPNLSILDLLFNLGPETLSYLKSDQF